ncbi:hypothetical protein CDD81_4398 [Ophiocordyceps australis]|uniref:DUF3752 domain-containing protein n=1 Tax=Ophiocordyceps australis TaxID=1399860 RepID=A0A2C5YHA8_9HYPO|nr:hypothetical protein CDD81_4398 [Ophiocordyceps australis]
MHPIGPSLPPPNGSKRKLVTSDNEQDDGPATQQRDLPLAKHPRRDQAPINEQEISLNQDDDDDEDDDFGPNPPRQSAPTSSQSIGPLMPNEAAPAKAEPDSEKSPPSSPTSSSDEDDDFGPALPSASAPNRRAAPIGPALPSDAAPQRDEWMLAPPPSSSSYSERDPTRIRNRKFASRPSAPKPSSSSNGPSIWTETPEEKLRRLQNAVLGRADANDAMPPPGSHGTSETDDERNRKIAANIEAQRGKSLYQEHSQKRRDKSGARHGNDEEDDPSARAFDKEKDMKIGTKIGTAQRRELVSKSAGFGGRFQQGSYL